MKVNILSSIFFSYLIEENERHSKLIIVKVLSEMFSWTINEFLNINSTFFGKKKKKMEETFNEYR